MTNPDPQSKHYLASLADAPLPDTLWPRVDNARRRRLQIRSAAAAASAACAAIGLALAFTFAPDRHEASAPAVATEGRQAAPSSSPPLDEADLVHSLSAIDKALQAAYDRNASDDEIAPLWQARQHLIDSAHPDIFKKG